MAESTGPTALVNGRILLPDRIVDGQALLIDGGTIVAVTERDALGADVPTVDVGSRWIAPGLIDIHTHGAVGHSFNEPTAEAWSAIACENISRGVTSLLATTSTAPLDNLLECLAFGAEWMNNRQDGAQIIGLHVEGPYFAFAQRGAQDPSHMRTPDDGSPDQLLAFHDIIRIMSYAPELPGALALTERLVRLGIVAAAGHSAATDRDVAAAMKAGLNHTIHIWSGQSTTIREGPWRVPGLLEATLASDSLTGEMISDNRHLPPTLMKLAYKCLGPDRLCAISDATNGAGLPDGTVFGMGDMRYDVHDGVAMMLNPERVRRQLDDAQPHGADLRDAVGIPLVEAVRMASLTPARVIGFGDRKGSLEAGKDADVAVFDDDFRVWRTMIGGEWAYERLS